MLLLLNRYWMLDAGYWITRNPQVVASRISSILDPKTRISPGR